MFPKNRGTPKSSILIGFSIINHPFWGKTPYVWKHPYSITPWPFTQTHPTKSVPLAADSSLQADWCQSPLPLGMGVVLDELWKNVRVMSCETAVGSKKDNKPWKKCWQMQKNNLQSFWVLALSHPIFPNKDFVGCMHFMAVKMCFPNLAYQFG